MTFGERLALRRKRLNLSRKELAAQVGTSAPIIGRYERGEILPSIETAVKLAQALDVSLDYLAGNTEEILDREVLQRVLELQRLPDRDREMIFFTLDALLRDAKTRQAYGS